MQLYFKESGQGQPVILLHGLFGSSDNWHTIAARLAEKFHVFAPDQRNHGQSPHSAEMDYPLMAADVDEFFTARGVESAMVIGHSMGGKTAMQLALQFPQRVHKLVVADIAPRAYAPAHDKIFAALLALDLASFQNRTQMEEALAPEIPGLVLRRFLLKNLGRSPAGGFFWKINLQGLAENYWRLREPVIGAGPFTGPTLFIRGGKSDYVQAEDEPLIREWFPAARIETIAEAGHWLHADKPEEFLRLVLGFL
ncbi:MAG TPA: alpha/beta fold hydrolase [Verrucomicrobiae bacterium]|jgi:pimeloyl-ACP methyl ester carboxylesterase|nr:alpha/beta fold hydrolase [Verrucomicrobiae bacterium]